MNREGSLVSPVPDERMGWFPAIDGVPPVKGVKRGLAPPAGNPD